MHSRALNPWLSALLRLVFCALALALPTVSNPLRAQTSQGSFDNGTGTYFVAYRTPAHVARSQADVFYGITDGLREFLDSRKVVLVSDSSQRTIRTEALLSRETLLNRARQAGAAYLLYVTVDRPLSSWVKITLQCFDLSGTLLWEERTSDKWRVTGKGGVEKSLEKMQNRLAPRLGGPGLKLLEPGRSTATQLATATPAAPVAPLAEKGSSPAHDWWLKVGDQAFVVTESEATYRAKLEVGKNAGRLAISPAGDLLAIASDGAVQTHTTFTGTLEHWPEAGSHSSITLIRKPDYKLAGQYTVPFRPHFIEFTNDGKKLVIVSLGQVSNDAKKHISPQISLLEVSSGNLQSQVELASEPVDFWYLPSANRLIVPCRGMKKRLGAPPELVIYDTTTGAWQKTPLSSSPFGWNETARDDLRYLLLEDAVVVVNSLGNATGPAEAKMETVFFVAGPEEKQFFWGGKSKDQGRLIIFEDGQVLKNIETPAPQTISFDAKSSRVILCAKGQGIILDAHTFAELARIPLPDQIMEAQLDPAGKYLYVNEPSGHVSVMDLDTKQSIIRFASGRGGVKFVQSVAIPALMMASSAITYRITGTPGTFPFANFPLGVQSLAFSPSGNFLYVFNTQTNDVTVVETRGHTILRKVALGPGLRNAQEAADLGEYSAWRTPDGRYLISSQGNKVLVLETEKGEILTDQKFNAVKLRYVPSLDMVFVQRASGTDVYRAAPFELIKDLQPSEKLAFRPKHVKLSERAPGKFVPPEELVFKPEARRFFLFSPKGVSIYDYDLKLIGEIEGVSGSNDVDVLR